MQSDQEEMRVDPEHGNNADFLVDKIVNELVAAEGNGAPKVVLTVPVEI